MKTYRFTLVLAGLFFAGLLALWWLESSGVLTEAQRRERMEHILPNLMDVPETSVTRVEITRKGETLAFERRGQGHWQMTEPVDVAADPSNLETLIRNLKSLRRSPDTGTIRGPGEKYGLAPPTAVVRLWESEGSAADKTSEPLAVLEIGKPENARDFCYARPAGAQDIEVIGLKLFATVDRPPVDWREQNLVPIPSFQVTRLAVHRQGLDLNAERSDSGRWRLTAPVSFPGNGPKIESLLGALSAIRVVDGAKGFVADNAKDLAPYGLAPADATIELYTADQADTPLVLEVGKKPADHPDRVYVRRGDQDDVVMVADRFLPEIPKDSITLRAQDVTDIVPAAVSKIEIKALNTTFALVHQSDGWTLRSPHEENADAALVQKLLIALDGLKTSEFLPPAKVIRPSLSPPVWDLKVWQSRSNSRSATENAAKSGSSDEVPVLALRIGRHDALRKTVYGQVEGDSVILALPDSLLDVLPRNTYAFRDRLVLSVSPTSVSKLTVIRPGVRTVLEPDRSAQRPNRWRMVEPSKAPADNAATTQVLALLSDLRADELVAELTGDGKPFGLDHPSIVASWILGTTQGQTSSPDVKSKPAAPASSSHSAGTLKIGKPVPGKPGTFFAMVEGQPFVFSLGTVAVQALEAEFHDTHVVSLPPDSIRRLVFRVPGRTLAFVRAAHPTGSPADWSPEPGTDASGVDLSRFHDLVVHLSQLRTTRYFQYDGPFPVSAGLDRPRLVLEFHTVDGKSRIVRFGATTGSMIFAATGTGNSGSIFLLPAVAWNALIQSFTSGQELPQNVFAP
ncbi:MAG: DUF4340 domain-containing protein [Isosphaeraceae bacterium]